MVKGTTAAVETGRKSGKLFRKQEEVQSKSVQSHTPSSSFISAEGSFFKGVQTKCKHCTGEQEVQAQFIPALQRAESCNDLQRQEETVDSESAQPVGQAADLQMQCAECSKDELSQNLLQRATEDKSIQKSPEVTDEAPEVQTACADCEAESVQKSSAQTTSTGVQPSLKVGTPNDCYEKEADQMATQVMRMPDAHFSARDSLSSANSNTIHRKEEEEPAEIQGKITQKAAGLQRTQEGLQTTPSFTTRLQSSLSGGKTIPSPVLLGMQSAFNADFSSIQIHTGTTAASLNNEIGAKAFTFRRHIFFNDGNFQPDLASGRALLAHELTHTLQQQAGLMRKEQAAEAVPGSAEQSASVCGDPATSGIQVEAVKGTEKTDIPANGGIASPQESKNIPNQAPTSPPGTQTSTEQEPAKPTQVKSKSITDPQEDTAFQGVVGDSKKSKTSQAQHEKDSAKAEEAFLSAENPTDKEPQENAAKKVLGLDEQLGDSEIQFDKAAFKKSVLDLVQKEIPDTENSNKDFQADGAAKLKSSATQTTKGAQPAEREKMQNIENASAPSDANLLYAKDEKPSTPEEPGRTPKIGEAERAIPKPVPVEEVQMDKEHDADSLDKAMEDESLKQFNAKLSNDQLAQSNESEFVATLEEKKTSQKELCKVPEKYQQKENVAHIDQVEDAEKNLSASSKGKFNTRKDAFENIEAGKQKTKTQDELLLEAYYSKIACIYDRSNAAVTKLLGDLDTEVSSIFETAITDANQHFKSRVKSRLDDYYGVGWSNLSEEDEDEYERGFNSELDKQLFWLEFSRKRASGSQKAHLESQIRRLKSMRMETIVDRVFKEEKATFVGKLDTALDTVAEKIDLAMKTARSIIKKGKTDIECESSLLPANLKTEAEERTKDFMDRFNDLEKTVNEKQKDLAESLAKEYAKNVKQLKDTFEQIRKESALSFWERAWIAIKKIAMIVYDLGKLLVEVLIKAASVIGDIIAHPIRFFGNLISAVGDGFRNFKDNIGTHLENIIFKLILGTVPPNIKLPTTWDAPGLFSFALDLIGLSKDNIRAQAVKRLTEPVVQWLEESFDLFILFKKEGFAGLWEHIKDKIGDLKEQVIEQIKTYFKESIIAAAIKLLLSALTPASGFIKACESILNVVKFFLENLKNLLMLFNSILDSMIDIAKGNIASASKRIETALADILLIGLKFLAALVGIDLDKISSKVTQIFNAVKNPVNRAIKWFLDKAVAFSKKLGVDKAVKGAKAGVAKTKEWVAEKGKQGAAKVLGWLGFKKEFKADDGRSHSIYFKATDQNADLMIASTPQTFIKFVNSIKIDPSNQAQVAARDRARELAKEIDQMKRERLRMKTDGELKTQSPEFTKKLEELAQVSSKLFHNTGLQVSSPPSFGGLRGGFGVSVVVERLTKLGPSGSKPNTMSEAWNVLRQRKSLQGGRSYYVRGHLLNHLMHGSGAIWENLTPIEQGTNTRYEAQVENPVYQLIHQGKSVHFEVRAVYGRNINKELESAFVKQGRATKAEIVRNERFVPTRLEANWYVIGEKQATKQNVDVGNEIDSTQSSYVT